MSSNIYVLNSDPDTVLEFLDEHPAAIVLQSGSLDEEALNFISTHCLTKYFFVVDPIAWIVDFDFTFRPGEYEDGYVHIWQQSWWIRHFTTSQIRGNCAMYTDEALWRGLIALKHHDEIIYGEEPQGAGRIRNEPDVYILSPTKALADAFVTKYNLPRERCWVIRTTEGLTTEAMERILSKNIGSYFFYVVDVKTLIKEPFDFTFVPDHWDASYVHAWNMCNGVRLFNRQLVEMNVTAFTDEGWAGGKVEIKNIEQDIFEVQPDEVFRLNLVDTENVTMLVAPSGVTMDDIDDALAYSAMSPYVYFIKDNTEVIDDFDFTFLPEHVWEDELIHIWNNKSNIMFVSREILLNNPEWLLSWDVNHYVSHTDVNIYKSYGNTHSLVVTDETFHSNLPASGSGYFFAIDPDVDLVKGFDLSFVPDIWDEGKIHKWQRINPHTGFVYDYSGLELMCFGMADGEQYIREPGSISKPFDVFMLSYKEEFADNAFKALQEVVPNAKRIHGVKGIYEAHMEAAKQSLTPMFYVVDADAIIEDGFDFSFMPAKADYHKVYTWRSKNPINGLLYGFGGVKLFPKQVLLDATGYKIDFTTSITEDFVPMAQISNVTCIDADPFTAWKSAFRECVKLSAKVMENEDDGVQDRETRDRLKTWCTTGKDSPNGEYAIQGALCGKLYGEQHRNNLEELARINNYEWLEEQFRCTYRTNKI